jgi:hypothetical protein
MFLEGLQIAKLKSGDRMKPTEKAVGFAKGTASPQGRFRTLTLSTDDIQ